MDFPVGADTRFMSISEKAIKLHIPTPDDGMSHHSVGYLKLGVDEAYKKALKLRNLRGKTLWKSHWNNVIGDHDYLYRLPKNLVSSGNKD